MFKMFDEPESRNEGACLRDMMNPESPNEGGVFKKYYEPESPNQAAC